MICKEVVSEIRHNAHHPEQAVQHNDRKCYDLGIRTENINLPDFYSQFHVSMSWRSHGGFSLSRLYDNVVY